MEEENNQSIDINIQSLLDLLNSSGLTDRELHYCWECMKWVTDHDGMDH